jgi:hypothetical protein
MQLQIIDHEKVARGELDEVVAHAEHARTVERKKSSSRSCHVAPGCGGAKCSGRV